MTKERKLCNGDAPQEKSVYDQQRIARPAIYMYCGRASFGIGVLCMLAEVSVFIIKRGLTSMGIGIWTGAPFVLLGAVTMAVPKTRTVCSINTCLVFCVASLAIAFIGVLLCIAHILELSLILQQQYTPSPNFELHCRGCGHYIVIKETGQIGLLLLQSLVSAILLCFAYKDCLCCHPTETHLVTASTLCTRESP
ncbi:hypothetical protein BOX15_Mlig005930g4 [Macrostomum lignano]|uniref:Uncharacterized protein n=1 Tax=Macrostomum lignano TaxID=282301 RepID=A0A267DGP4_9PLAT|nr:hypothetical protein BOX15_Mlig005930g4 [Macrostomum lignano]